MNPEHSDARDTPAVRSMAAVTAAITAIAGQTPVLAAASSGHAHPEAETTLTGLALNTSTLRPGNLFVGLPGARSHGARFAGRAVAVGALAILTDAAGAQLVAEADELVDVPVLVSETSELRALVAHLAAWWHDTPSASMTSFAVTGTNGKTTTTYLLDALGQLLGRRTGLVGTVEIRSGRTVIPSVLTTPEAPDLQEYLAQMRDDDVSMLAMEVSSHALSLRRVDGIVYDVAGFTNLSQDHLDFHEDFESYFAAKARLFTPQHARRAVVCVDDEWGRRLAREATVPVATLATHERSSDAEPVTHWYVTDVDARTSTTSFQVRHRDGRSVSVTTTLPGSFNVSNVALAIVMLVESGTSTEDLGRALDAVGVLDPHVPGRMETVGSAPRTIVDFAHNPDALSLSLQALRPTTHGRLIVVFGATGDRDRGKRPIMGRIAAELADVVVVTDDDPHNEAPEPIRAAVLAGARSAGTTTRCDIREIAPREAAIRETIVTAHASDTVLLAGRGHEVWQDVGGVDRPLDDRVEARAAHAERQASTTADRTTPDHTTRHSTEGQE